MIASPAQSGGVCLRGILAPKRKAIPHCSQASLAFVAALNSNPARGVWGREKGRRRPDETRRDETARQTKTDGQAQGSRIRWFAHASCLMPHALVLVPQDPPLGTSNSACFDDRASS